LKFRSKFKYDKISGFLPYLCNPRSITIKYWPQEVTSSKLGKRPLRDYETAFCLPLALMVLVEKICKDLVIFSGFPLPVWKIFGTTESGKQNLKFILTKKLTCHLYKKKTILCVLN
jgi:hypothetical protein